MALTQEQIEAVKRIKAKNSGIQAAENVSREDARMLLSLEEIQKNEVLPSSFIRRAKDRFKEAGERATRSLVDIGRAEMSGEQNRARSVFQATGSLLSAGADFAYGTALDAAVPDFIAAPAKAKAKELMETEAGKKGVEAMQKLAEGAVNKWNEYEKENPVYARDLKALVGYAELYPGSEIAREIGETFTNALRGTTRTAVKVASEGAEELASVARRVAESPQVSGITAKSSELAGRIPRAAERGAESLRESAVRAERIKNATPEVAQAIKSSLDDRVIDAVTTADDATKAAQKEMVKLAEDSKKKLGLSRRPEYVAGDAAANQYKILEKQRELIGDEIGNATKELSKTSTVSVVEEIDNLKRLLSEQGISFNGKGINTTGSNFTNAQRRKIKELYKLATETGTEITPYQVYQRDKLFSQLQRESRFSEIGDIIVETKNGPESIFSLFRDVFSKKLDTLSPEIREINTRYKDVRRMLNDIENTIVKTGNLESVKGIDLAEVAQTRLRRLSSDAQSAAEYRAIVEKMDEYARKFGYDGPNPAELSDFAVALRDIYPTAIPQTSATEIMKPTFSSVVSKVLQAGAPDIRDQQAALRLLLGIE